MGRVLGNVALGCGGAEALLAVWLSQHGDRRRAWLGLVLALIPVALLGYFVAFTVD